MYTLNVEDDQGRKMEVPFGPGIVTVGRDPSNTVRLDERNISRTHARINAQNGTVFLEDAGSSYGVRLNGDKVTGKVPLFLNDRIQLGDFTLQVFGESLRLRPEEITQKTSVPSKSTAEEVTNTQPMLVSPVGQQEEEDHESTAIIRITDAERRGSASQAGTISGPHPKLFCTKGPLAGKEWLVSKTEMVIGRDDSNDIAIDHRSISRHHAKLQFEGGKYRIVDLKSANGTLVNGEEYAQVELKRGDVLELGHVKLRLVWPGESAPVIDRSNDKVDDDEATEIKFVPKRSSKSKGPWLAISAGAVVVTAGVVAFVFLSGPDSTKPLPTTAPPAIHPQNGTEPAVPQAIVNEPPAELVLQEAAAESAKEKWDIALGMLRAGLKGHPENAALQQAIERAEMERGAKSTLDAAEAAFDRGDASTAKELFQQIAESSKYFPRASKRLGDLKTAKEPKQVRNNPRPQKGRSTAGEASPPNKAEPTKNEAVAPTQATGSVRDQARKLFEQGNQAVLQLRLKEAIEFYNEAIAKDPKFPLPHRGLGIAYARANNGNAAIEHYREYLKLAPGAGDAEQVRKIIHDYDPEE